MVARVLLPVNLISAIFTIFFFYLLYISFSVSAFYLLTDNH